MMKSIAFVLCAAACVAGQDQAPADGSSVNCRDNNECTMFDAAAQCRDGMCACSNPQDATAYCTDGAGQEGEAVQPLRMSFIYGDITCDELDDAVRAQIQTEVNQRVQYTVTDFNIVCGSVIVTYSVEATANTVDTVLQQTTNSMQQVQQAIPLLANSSVTTETVLGNDTQQCTIENSDSTVLLEGRICFPTCNANYTRVENNGTYSCVEEMTPLAVPAEVVVANTDCRSDAECRTFDTTAQCLENMCECTNTEDRSRFCTASAGNAATSFVFLRLSFIFNSVNCNQLNAAIRAQIQVEVFRKVTYTVIDYAIVCGSVIVTYGINVPVKDVDTALQQTTNSMQQVQQAVPLLATSSLSTEVVYGNKTQQCTVANAASTILLEAKICFPTCNTGFTRVLVSKLNETSAYSCNSNNNSDDDLSSTAIAAIVVACVLFCVIIVAVIYFLMGKPNGEAAADKASNEPYSDQQDGEGAAEEQAQDVTV